MVELTREPFLARGRCKLSCCLREGCSLIRGDRILLVTIVPSARFQHYFQIFLLYLLVSSYCHPDKTKLFFDCSKKKEYPRGVRRFLQSLAVLVKTVCSFWLPVSAPQTGRWWQARCGLFWLMIIFLSDSMRACTFPVLGMVFLSAWPCLIVQPNGQ